MTKSFLSKPISPIKGKRKFDIVIESFKKYHAFSWKPESAVATTSNGRIRILESDGWNYMDLKTLLEIFNHKLDHLGIEMLFDKVISEKFDKFVSPCFNSGLGYKESDLFKR